MNFEEKIIERLKRLEREVERLRVKERPAGGSGVTDHGALSGLADNDHPQYLLTTGKAADADKLDGLNSTDFVLASGFGEWVTYTPTTYGFSGTPYSNGHYLVIGKIMFFHVVAEGTSNSSSTYVYLPSGFKAGSSISGRNQMGLCFGTNNGTTLTTPARWAIANGATYLRFHRDAAGTSWTGSGDKQVEAMGFIYVVPE